MHEPLEPDHESQAEQGGAIVDSAEAVGPPRDLLERGLVAEDTAFLVCRSGGQPYVFDEDADGDGDPHDCFCDADRHALTDQPDAAQLVCGSCRARSADADATITIAPSDDGGATYACACDATSYTILSKSIYRTNAGVFL